MSHIFLNEKSSFGSTGSGKSERNSFHFAFVPFFAFLIVSPLACAHTAKSSQVLTPSYPLRSMVAAFHSAFFQASEQIFLFFIEEKRPFFTFLSARGAFCNSNSHHFALELSHRDTFGAVRLAKTASILPFRLIILPRDYHFFCPFSHTSPVFHWKTEYSRLPEPFSHSRTLDDKKSFSLSSGNSPNFLARMKKKHFHSIKRLSRRFCAIKSFFHGVHV